MRTTLSKTVPVTTAALLLLLAVTACGSGGAGTRAPRGSMDRMTAEELEADAAQDLFSVLQRRRPRWLQNRAPATAQGRQQIAVILDGVRQQGSVEVLRNIKTSDVQEVWFVNARDATTRYGTDMTAGAIEIVTKRGR